MHTRAADSESRCWIRHQSPRRSRVAVPATVRTAIWNLDHYEFIYEFKYFRIHRYEFIYYEFINYEFIMYYAFIGLEFMFLFL